MIRRALRRITFDHVAIAFIIVVTACLYYLAADALLHFAASSATDSHKPARADVVAPANGPHASAAPADGATVTSDRIADVFARIGYRLDTVRADGEVPRVFLASLPSDLSDIAVPERRKIMFIETALPLILHVNELIALDRERVIDLRDRVAAGRAISAADRTWLERAAAAYGLDRVDMDELVRRVDVIPPSLALAQSAEESGWGTSRFAQEGNALFGQRTWSDDGGLVPSQRGDGDSYRVAAFDQLMDGVKSYAFNLNSHPAYAELRRVRAQIRSRGETPDGYTLAGALTSYSERGADYINTIRFLMRENDLAAFDRAKLNAPELVNLIDHVKRGAPTS